jgi:hypothetical protein
MSEPMAGSTGDKTADQYEPATFCPAGSESEEIDI